jgi:hypothetical protein
LAWVGQNGRQKIFTQAAMQGRWAPPLSLVKNIKFISLKILIILEPASILILNYVRSSLPAILETIISVLGS